MGVSAFHAMLMRVLKVGSVHSRVLIVGTETIAKLVAEELSRNKHLGMKVVGFMSSEPGRVTLSYGNPSRVSLPVFPVGSLLQTAKVEGVNRILVAASEGSPDFPARELMMLRVRGLEVQDCHSFYERLTGQISIADLRPGWFALSEGFHRTRWILFLKRAIDISVSVVGLIVAAPMSLLTAVAIKLDSPGPVIYRQERVGQDGRPFILYKFRSMIHNAEAETGPVWACRNDPRVTRVGRFIRKLRIDEIPQVYNVLKGEMSFVGPRPERPCFVSRLRRNVPYYDLRLSVKPGITGWAQISCSSRDGEQDNTEKLQYDLYYVKHLSPIFDLKIILQTCKFILFGRR